MDRRADVPRPLFAALALLAALLPVTPAVAQGSAPAAAAPAPAVAPPATAAPAAASPAVAPPKLGGYMQVREVAVHGAGVSMLLNRARLSADGTLPSRFAYRVLVEFEASAGVKNPATPSLREAYVRWSPAPLVFTMGQVKAPFSREYLVPISQLETADLSAVIDSLAPKYEIGAMGEWTPGPWGSLALGVFDGEGANAIANRDSVAIVVARATARPVAPVSLGASLSRDSADSLRWGVDGLVEQWGATLRADWILKHRRARAHDQDDFGWAVFGAYRVHPQVQAFARQEDFQRPAYGIARRVRSTAVGVNWEIAPARVKLLLQGFRRASGARQTKTDAFIAQLQVKY